MRQPSLWPAPPSGLPTTPWPPASRFLAIMPYLPTIDGYSRSFKALNTDLIAQESLPLPNATRSEPARPTGSTTHV